MKALSGIRMLELSHMVSGPYAGMILADMGVEAIKVEPPVHGEMTRNLMANEPRFNVDGMGPYFLTFGRNKKSVTINLKSDKGLQLFYDLVKESDVVLNNYSVGVVKRLKIDHDHLSKINSRIITCSITGFGETGPDNKLPSYDMVAQAMSGVMSITGHPDDPPTRAGIPIADTNASMMAVIGILSALMARNQTGRGQHVDISMLDSQISTLNYAAAIYFMSKEIPGRIGNAHINHVPYDVYPCSDGHIILALAADEFWPNLLTVVDLPHLDTEENKQRPGRQKNRKLIDKELEEIFRTQDRRYWMEKLRAARIPCAPVYDFNEAFSNPQVIARNMAVDVDYPNGHSVRVVGNPVKLSDTYADTFTSAPLLGQHNHEIFAELLGRSDTELDTLKEKGAI
ncbi:MAG TPA: CoA transferase [Anaerolineales bacterium]|nr:CoA transferase [Anaerolineales bacterium]